MQILPDLWPAAFPEEPKQLSGLPPEMNALPSAPRPAVAAAETGCFGFQEAGLAPDWENMKLWGICCGRIGIGIGSTIELLPSATGKGTVYEAGRHIFLWICILPGRW